MKIGIFTDTYTPQINGVVTVIQTMERGLAKLGHQVYLFAPSDPEKARVERGRVVGCTYRFPSFKFIFHDEYRVVIPYIRKARPVFPNLDIVHSHDPFSMGLLAIHISQKYNIPHIHHYHTFYAEYRHYLPKPIRPSRKMAERLSAAFCNRCDCIIAPSHEMKEELVRYGIHKPVFSLPFGIDMEQFSKDKSFDLRNELNLPKEEDLLLYAGRLGKEKNLKFLLRAFKQMSEQKERIRLIVAGEGPYRKELEEYIEELKLGDRVIMLGYLDREKLIDFYKGADLFIFASKTETQGLVLMESMAAGTPVVAIGEMGVLEVVKDKETGILVREDEKEFAEETLKLLEDKEKRKRMGEKAKEHAYSMSAQNSVEKLLEIYRSSLS